MGKKKTIAGRILKAAVIGGTSYMAACFTAFTKIFNVEYSWLKSKLGDMKAEPVEGEDVFIRSFDDLQLHAKMIEHHPGSRRWLIPVHGYAAEGNTMKRIIEDADEQGFNLLVPDLRAHGASEGTYTGFGWTEHYDLYGWIEFLTGIRPDAEIALYGISLGAAIVMNTVGEKMPPNVRCAVEDCGFSDIRDILEYNLEKILHMRADILIPGTDLFVKQFLHYSMYDVSTRRQLMNAEVPVMFIHGDEDTLVPVRMGYENYHACAGIKELYIVKGAGHAEAWNDETCRSRVFEFIGRYM